MSVVRGKKRFSGIALAALLALSATVFAWASTLGEYTQEMEVWGITEISGDFAVFCNRGNVLLDVRRLDIPSVTWSDLGNEVDGIVVRTGGDGAVVADFTLPET